MVFGQTEGSFAAQNSTPEKNPSLSEPAFISSQGNQSMPGLGQYLAQHNNLMGDSLSP